MAADADDSALPRGPLLGVTAARDPAGALGTWTTREAVAIAVPDGTRRVDLPSALSALDEHLPARGPVVVGLGLHRPMREDELGPIADWSAIQHNPDDCIRTVEVDGIPGSVGRPIAEAPWSISVGVGELHQYAGISGGHKGVAVGCGGRETIAALHHRDRVMAQGVEVGRLDGNPFRAAVDSLGHAARCRLALLYLPAVDLWLAGEPVAVVQDAVRRLTPWTRVADPASAAVVHVQGPKAVSLYQASRAATYLALSPAPPLLPGATIAIEAACPEGLGSEAGFHAALHSGPPPWTHLLTGPPPTGPGAQRAVMLALLAREYRLVVYGVDDPAPLLAAGIEAHTQPAPTDSTWLQVPRPFQSLPQWARGED